MSSAAIPKYITNRTNTCKTNPNSKVEPAVVVMDEDPLEKPWTASFYKQLKTLTMLRFYLTLSSRKHVLIILVTLSWLLFIVMVLAFEGMIVIETSDTMTDDMIFKGLENFIFVSIAGIFLFQQIEDF